MNANLLKALREGRLPFATFATATAADWRRLALHLMGRWDPGPAVDVEDVEQELRLGAWLAVGRWDPARGATIGRFVVYQACDRAKRFIHRQRRANRQKDRSPPRYDLALGDKVLRVVPAEVDVERVADHVLALESMLALLPYSHAECIAAAVLLGSPRAAGTALFRSPSIRARRGWVRPADAHSAVAVAITLAAQFAPAP
jgi:DNA-directed RNA polymerase specialized sigma24 family protein